MPERPVRGRRRLRAAAWLARGLMAAVLGLGLAFFVATRTDRGAEAVVERVLSRLPIEGEITANRARSDRLLEGVRLYELTIRGGDGRLFLIADSARVSYDWRTFLAGDVVFDTLELWRPRVMLTRYPGEAEFNVQRLFVSEEEAQDTARAPLQNVIFRGVALHGGEIRVLYPAAPDGGGRWVTLPSPSGGGTLVRHTFAGVEARLPSVTLQSPDSVGQRVEIDSLAFFGQVLEDPLRVRDLRGRLRHLDGRIDLEMERLVLDQSTLAGSAFVELEPGDRPIRFGFEADAEKLELGDLQWADPRVPAGRVSGRVVLEAQGDKRRLEFEAFDLADGQSRVELDGAVAITGERFAFEGLSVRAAPLLLSAVAPWLDRDLPLEGIVEGTAELNGSPEEVDARGRITLRRPEQGPITADFSGVLHLGATPAEGFGFTDLRATLDPFDFGVLGELAEGVAIAGPGRLTFQATGHTSEAIRFTTDVHHRPVGLPPSDLIAQGSVSRRGEDWVIDVQADVAPLSLTALNRYYPELPLSGEVTGAVRARGALTDLTLTTDLTTEAGRLALTSRFDATRPGEHYAIEGEVAQFELSELVTSLPAPTRVTGFVDIEGRGTDPGTMTLDVRTRLRASRVGGLIVDSAALTLRARDGLLFVDSLDGMVGGIEVRGSGALALDSAGPAGTVALSFQSDSLGRLRPLALGDVVIARDTLTALDRELLLAQGIDPDTLPTQAEVAVGGSVRGTLTLTGSVRDFAARGQATFGRVRYGPHVARGATVDFEGTDLPSLDGRFAGRLSADSLTLFDRAFTGGELELEYARPGGRFDLRLQRSRGEEYGARARFEARRGAGSVQLEELALRFDSVTWALQGPAVVGWDAAGVRIEELVVASSEDGARIEVDGSVPREGSADLTLNLVGLPLDRLAGLAQREDLGIEGQLDIATRIEGTRASPRITGRFDATDLSFTTFSLTRLAGQMEYGDRTMRVVIAAWQDSARVLTASGQVPVDLALQDVARRVPTDRQMNLAVVADSLPAALPLAYLSVMEEVTGTLSGVFQIGGTVDDPSTAGTLDLNDAGWTLPAIGVRHSEVSGTLALRSDGTVDVNASGRAEGTITATGRVLLQPLTDPTFDLEITAEAFKAAQRLDVEGTVSGTVTLGGTYTRPFVRSRPGAPLRVDEGILYVEEFQRTASVVDLADPAFFAVVDTSVVNPRPLQGASANPFLRNLRVDVDLTAERNTWLRSEDMNVEMAGELDVVYDRQSRVLVMLGALQAIRGTYSVLGRSFQVESGTVEFVGTPGINPILDIVASTEVRPTSGGGDPIAIQAVVSGTLQSPRVDLSSTETAIAESDLVSYLVFGVPSYQLASGQTELLEGAAGSLLGSTIGAVSSIAQGIFASRLSSLVAREWGLDYFAISQPEQLGLSQTDISTTLGSTTFEVGWYLEEDVFLTLLLRPLGGGVVAEGVDPFGGARLDWVLTNTWTLQAFFEDRYIRQPTLGFDQQLLNQRKVAGVFLFRDWGYGGPDDGGPPPVPRPADQTVREEPTPAAPAR
jgi:autotransporter translocation and assembly factor TamB